MYRTTLLLLLWLLPLVSCHAIQDKHEKDESPENDTTKRIQQAFHKAVANVYRTSRKSRSNQATFVESKFPLLDHGRQTLSKDCSNALLELKQDTVALQQASLDLSDEVEQAVSLCDSNADICQVDEYTLPSSRDFVQACVQDAGGAIWEYHVQITCTLLQTNPTNGIIDIVDTVVFQYLNSDECADPTHCNRNDLGQAAEREADILSQGVEQQLELLFALMTNTGTESPYSVECDSRVTDNDQPLATPATLRTTSSATRLAQTTRERWRFLGLLPIMLVGILGY